VQCARAHASHGSPAQHTGRTSHGTNVTAKKTSLHAATHTHTHTHHTHTHTHARTHTHTHAHTHAHTHTAAHFTGSRLTAHGKHHTARQEQESKRFSMHRSRKRTSHATERGSNAANSIGQTLPKQTQNTDAVFRDSDDANTSVWSPSNAANAQLRVETVCLRSSVAAKANAKR
jgi:hypothetical protein